VKTKNKRTNKEFSLSENCPFNVKIGTIDKNNPSVIYINGHGWIKPTSEMNYGKIMNMVERRFEKKLMERIGKTNGFLDDYIMNFESCPNYMKIDKKTFINFEAYIKQKKDCIKIEDVRDKLTVPLKNLANDLVDIVSDENFEMC
jgi:hypothetical protein